MACCTGCGRYPAAEQQFGAAAARRDLDRYRRRGPDASSRLLLESVAGSVRNGDSLIDVGAGVGVLSLELLAKGLEHATLVDASPAYLQTAQTEATQRGLSSRVDCVGADLVHVAARLRGADLVTMHRVICCYSDWAALLDNATQLSRRLFVFSYPRDQWHVRAFMGLENARRRMFGNAFRTFIHPPDEMERRVLNAGFQRIDRHQTPIWCIDAYERTETA